jgi:hypothetical protein
MAFCTTCGANVQGAFCTQCGAVAPVQAASQAAPQTPPPAPNPGYNPPPNQGYNPGQPVPPAMTPVPAGTNVAAPPVRGKLGCLGWGLIAAGVVVVLGLIALASLGALASYFVHNPGLALAKVITAANPDAEVLSTDAGSQSMRIRNRKTGEEVTLSFDDVKNGRFKMRAIDKEGKEANVEIGGGAGKLPSWVPVYPGARAQGNITARGEDANNMGEGGIVSFTTPDSAAQVTSFYEAKCKEMGMDVKLTSTGTDGGLVAATDEGSQRTLTVMIGGGSGNTSFSITYGRKR